MQDKFNDIYIIQVYNVRKYYYLFNLRCWLCCSVDCKAVQFGNIIDENIVSYKAWNIVKLKLNNNRLGFL